MNSLASRLALLFALAVAVPAASHATAAVLLGDLSLLAEYSERGVIDEPSAQVEVDLRPASGVAAEALLAAVVPVTLSARTAEAGIVRARVLVARLRELANAEGLHAVERAAAPDLPAAVPAPEPSP